MKITSKILSKQGDAQSCLTTPPNRGVSAVIVGQARKFIPKDQHREIYPEIEPEIRGDKDKKVALRFHLEVQVEGAVAWRLIPTEKNKRGEMKFQANDFDKKEEGKLFFTRECEAGYKPPIFSFSASSGDIRLFVLTDENQLQCHHIGLVIQKTLVYFVHHHVSNTRLFQKDEKSRRKGSLQMEEFFALRRKPSFRNLLKNMPEWEKKKTRSKSEVFNPKNNEGTVAWFSQADRQVGVIHMNYRGEMIPVKVHFSQCPPRDLGRRYLFRGEKVRVGKLKSISKEPTSRNRDEDVDKKPIVYEAKQVTLL